MAVFRYQAMDMAGHRQRGRAEAAGVAELARTLEAQGLILIDAEDAGRDADGASPFSGFRPRRRQALVEATRAMAALLTAGLPLARALDTAAGVVGGDVGASLRSVRADIERGDDLPTALARHGRTFPPVYVGLVRAGERSGDLDGAFRRLADQLEREDQLRSRIASAMIYPLLLAVVGGIAVVVLLLFVLPRFVELLEGAGATVPRSTAALLAVSRALRAVGPFLPIAFAGLALGAGAYLRTEPGRRTVAGIALRLPLIRSIRRDALAGASLLPGEGGPPFRGIDGIRGDSPDDVLVFLTSARTPLGPGPVLVQLAIDHDDETRERGLVADIVEWRGTARTRVEIEPDAAGLDLRYLSSLRGEPQWLPSWISNTLLPAGIELRIVPAEGNDCLCK